MKGIEAEVAEWNQILAVNVIAYALFAKYVVPEMKKVGGGAIINVCSMSGFVAQPNFVTYSATKGANTCTACPTGQKPTSVSGRCIPS